MKIVFIGCRDIKILGGIESYMLNLTAELVRLGHEPIVYCESNRDSIEEYNGVKLIYCKGPKSMFLCKPWIGLKATIRTLIKEKNVSIIHYNAWPPSMWCFIPRLFGVKSLMQGHGLEWQRSKYSPWQQKMMKFMEKVTAYMNQHLIMCSEGQTKYFKEKYNLNATTIPTAVNLPPKENCNDELTLKKFGLEKQKYFLFMARLVQDKNPDFLINGFKASKYKDMKLAIVGSNPANPTYVKKLQELAEDNENIVFTGALYGLEKETVLRNAYMFCIPSTIEGLSIGLLEAMIHKLPIIASDIDSNHELLGDCAVWVRPENSEDIRKAIEYSINNRDVLEGFINGNYNNVINNYTWDIVTKRYVSFLNSIGVE